MATLDVYLPFLSKWEGGVARRPNDRGGLTFRGVTLQTLRTLNPTATAHDLLGMSTTQWEALVDRLFWQRWQADRIESQSVAEMLVDWTWMSGRWGIVLPQAMRKGVGELVVNSVVRVMKISLKIFIPPRCTIQCSSLHRRDVATG